MGIAGLLRPASVSGRRRGLAAGGFRQSPPFPYRNTGTVTAATTARHSIEMDAGSFTVSAGGKAQRFMPFNRASVQNNSDQIIEFWINSDPNDNVVVLNRATQVLMDIELWNFTVKNLGASDFGADKVVVTVWNE